MSKTKLYGGILVAVLAGVLIAGAFTNWFGLAPTKTLVVKGSTTVQPIATAAAEEYMSANRDIDVQVSGGGSSVGIASVSNKSVDIGMASRPVKDKEMTATPSLLSLPICKDAVAVIVHKGNTITGLTTAQVKSIYTGTVTNWKDVGGADLAIVLVGRDSASGTRETFEEKVDVDEAELSANMEELNSNGAVYTKVKDTPGAIGYVGLGYVDTEIKALKVNDVAPSAATALDGTYPIARFLYMVTNGLPNEVATDFIKFVMSASGRAIVQEEGFIPFKAQYTDGTQLVLKGSTTVEPIATTAAEFFMMLFPEADVQVSGGGSSAGVTAAADGTANLGMASRTLKDTEKTANPTLKENGICKDAVAVIVHKDNAVSGLTKAQIVSIYKGEVTNWKDIGGADAAIVVIGRDSASGTRETFESKLSIKEADLTSTMQEKNSNGAVKESVQSTPGAIGYVGLGYVDANVKALTVDSVAPSEETAQSGTYAIARDLYFISKGDIPADSMAMDFFKFLVNTAFGEAIIEDEGFIYYWKEPADAANQVSLETFMV